MFLLPHARLPRKSRKPLPMPWCKGSNDRLPIIEPRAGDVSAYIPTQR